MHAHRFRIPNSVSQFPCVLIEQPPRHRAATSMPHRGAPNACCQVPGCSAGISNLPAYYSRYRICQLHVQMEQVELGDGELCRFCQLCGRFHQLEAFDDVRRSCRARLAKHNARRKLKLELQAAMPSVNSRALKRRSPRKPAVNSTSHKIDAVEHENTSSGSDAEMETYPLLDNETLKQELNLHHLVLPSCRPERPTGARYATELMASVPSSFQLTDGAACELVWQPVLTATTLACSPGHHHQMSPGSPPQSPAICFHASNDRCDLDVTDQSEVLSLWNEWGGDVATLVKPNAINLNLNLGAAKQPGQPPMFDLQAAPSLDLMLIEACEAFWAGQA